jgi:hypothetical protein
MEEYGSASLTAAAAPLLLTAFVTIPALVGGVSHFREPKSKPGVYEDKDGEATEQSMAAYSTTYPKIFLSIFSVLGFGTAVALAVLGTLNRSLDHLFLENWLTAGQWVGPLNGFIANEKVKC